MKLRALCRRTTLELVRDPLTLGFGLGFVVYYSRKEGAL